MPKTMKDFVAEARAVVREIPPAEAQRAASEGRALILDVREGEELAATGRVAGAVHVPRGFLEARADPEAAQPERALTAAREAGRAVHVLCASGARAALAAKTLHEMGYEAAVVTGGFTRWRDEGLEVERPG